MATIPVYTTFTAGSVLTAAQLNTQIVTAGAFFLQRPMCSVTNAAGLAGVATGVSTLVPFDTESEDNDSMHSTVTNNSRIIFQTLGWWAITPFSGWASSATGSRALDIRLNAAGASGGGTKLTGFSVQGAAASDTFQLSLAWRYRALNIGDYFEMFITQNSGGALSSGGSTNGCFALWETV